MRIPYAFEHFDVGSVFLLRAFKRDQSTSFSTSFDFSKAIGRDPGTIREVRIKRSEVRHARDEGVARVVDERGESGDDVIPDVRPVHHMGNLSCSESIRHWSASTTARIAPISMGSPSAVPVPCVWGDPGCAFRVERTSIVASRRAAEAPQGLEGPFGGEQRLDRLVHRRSSHRDDAANVVVVMLCARVRQPRRRFNFPDATTHGERDDCLASGRPDRTKAA